MHGLEGDVEEERGGGVVVADHGGCALRHQLRAVGAVGLHCDLVPVAEVVSTVVAVVVVALVSGQVAVESVEPSTLWPELLVAEPKVPLSNHVGFVASPKNNG